MQLVESVAQERVIVAGQGIDAREDERKRLLVAGQRLRGGTLSAGQRVADSRLADALQPGCDVPDLSCEQRARGNGLRPEVAELQDLALRGGSHEADAFM